MRKNLFMSGLLVLLFTSCSDYLDVNPVGLVIPTSIDDFRSFLTEAYGIKMDHKALTTYRTDDLVLAESALGVEQYRDIYLWNDDNPGTSTAPFPYASFYTAIFYTNHIIESAGEIEGDQGEVNQLVGEAYALRALQYFDLINLYAKAYRVTTAASDLGVPLVLQYEAERTYPRKSVQEIYDQILSDLEQSEGLLNVTQQETGYNYRFSRVAVKAFKSKVYLFMGAWQKAIDTAQDALSIQSELQDLNQETSIMASEYNSVESIMALQAVITFDIINNTTVSEDLLNAYDQTADLRFSTYFEENANGAYHSNKTAQSNFKCTFRTAGLYLTLAEAHARLGDDLSAGKTALLTLLRARYTADGYAELATELNTLDQEGLITKVLQERRKEFAFEGHRWNDLRRTTQPKIVKVLGGETYVLEQDDARYTLAFPQEAIINNSNLQ